MQTLDRVDIALAPIPPSLGRIGDSGDERADRCDRPAWRSDDVQMEKSRALVGNHLVRNIRIEPIEVGLHHRVEARETRLETDDGHGRPTFLDGCKEPNRLTAASLIRD